MYADPEADKADNSFIITIIGITATTATAVGSGFFQSNSNSNDSCKLINSG